MIETVGILLAEAVVNLAAIDAIPCAFVVFMRRTYRLNRIVRIGSAFDGSSITHHFALQIDLHAGTERHGVFVSAKCLPIDYRACQLVDDVSKLAVDDVFGHEFMVDILEIHLVLAEVVAVHAAVSAHADHAATIAVDAVNIAYVDTVLDNGRAVVAQPA